ncbi:tail tape measure protein, partial [Rhodovulum sulfidophilum]|nr:tail tape measure protein [Rhodovulum sulfidophilum]
MVGAFGVMAVKGMNAAKSINILAQRANATPEAFQKMAFAARTAGVEQDKLGDILQDVTDRVGEFLSTGSGEMSDFFEKIAPKVGVTAEQFRNLSGPQALQLYVDTLEKAGVNQQQMTFYMEALASDTTTLLPLLRNGGREMRKLGDAASDAGQIISDEMISDLQDANRSMSRVSATIEALEIKIAGAFAPTLSDAADKLDDLLSSADAADAISDMAEAFDGLSEAILSEDFLGAAASGIATVTDLAAGLARGAVTLSDNLELVTTAAD